MVRMTIPIICLKYSDGMLFMRSTFSAMLAAIVFCNASVIGVPVIANSEYTDDMDLAILVSACFSARSINCGAISMARFENISSDEFCALLRNVIISSTSSSIAKEVLKDFCFIASIIRGFMSLVIALT